MEKRKKEEGIKREAIDMLPFGLFVVGCYVAYYIFGQIFIVSFLALGLLIGLIGRIWRQSRCH